MYCDWESHSCQACEEYFLCRQVGNRDQRNSDKRERRNSYAAAARESGSWVGIQAAVVGFKRV